MHKSEILCKSAVGIILLSSMHSAYKFVEILYIVRHELFLYFWIDSKVGILEIYKGVLCKKSNTLENVLNKLNWMSFCCSSHNLVFTIFIVLGWEVASVLLGTYAIYNNFIPFHKISIFHFTQQFDINLLNFSLSSIFYSLANFRSVFTNWYSVTVSQQELESVLLVRLYKFFALH